MRNESLNAYSLHQRPYQEKRAIYYLLTYEHGILHGIAKKGIPQFVPLTLFATGKKSLKTLNQVNIATTVPTLVGIHQYAALYINEITLKLLPLEDPVSNIYLEYAQVISSLQTPLDSEALKLVLRHYEQTLFVELGYAIDLMQDCEQHSIDTDQYYRFSGETGWIADNSAASAAKTNSTSTNIHKPPDHNSPLKNSSLRGNDIIAMRAGINADNLALWTLIHKQLIDHLFDYKPLQSRLLWQQFQQYQ